MQFPVEVLLASCIMVDGRDKQGYAISIADCIALFVPAIRVRSSCGEGADLQMLAHESNHVLGGEWLGEILFRARETPFEPI